MQDDLFTKHLINFKDKITSAYIDLIVLIDLIDKDVITNETYIQLDNLRDIKRKLRRLYRQIKEEI